MLLCNGEGFARGPLRDRGYRLLQPDIDNCVAPLVVHFYLPIESVLGGYRSFAQQA
jgi:hypothetical protein